MVDRWKPWTMKSQYQKWVLMDRPKITQMGQHLFSQIVCPSPKVWDFDEKKALLGVRSPWTYVYHCTAKKGDHDFSIVMRFL